MNPFCQNCHKKYIVFRGRGVVRLLFILLSSQTSESVISCMHDGCSLTHFLLRWWWWWWWGGWWGGGWRFFSVIEPVVGHINCFARCIYCILLHPTMCNNATLQCINIYVCIVGETVNETDASEIVVVVIAVMGPRVVGTRLLFLLSLKQVGILKYFFTISVT